MMAVRPNRISSRAWVARAAAFALVIPVHGQTIIPTEETDDLAAIPGGIEGTVLDFGLEGGAAMPVPGPFTPQDASLLEDLGDMFAEPGFRLDSGTEPTGFEEVPEPEKAPPSELVGIAKRVAPSVVALRAFDRYGKELASGCGCFTSNDGKVLTDVQIVEPEIAGELAYITVVTGDGRHGRVSGFWSQDLVSGVTVLQTDLKDAPPLEVDAGFDFSQTRGVAVLALKASGALTLADAFVVADTTPSGKGWLNLWGDDSPGEPGSPVLTREGKVAALIAMRVPQGAWKSFGLAIGGVPDRQTRDAAKRPIAPLSLDKLRKAEPRSATADPRFLEVFQALQGGQTKRAKAGLLSLRLIYPRSAEVWALLGLATMREGDTLESVNCSRKAVALDPAIGQYWYQLSTTALAAGPRVKDGAVKEALERAVAAQPGNEIAMLLLAEQQVLAKDYAKAEQTLLNLVVTEPDDFRVLYLLAYARAKQGNYTGADAAVTRAIRLGPRNPRLWNLAGLLHLKAGRNAEALQAFERMVALDRKNPRAWRTLSQMQQRMGRDTDARLSMEKGRSLAQKAAQGRAKPAR